MQSQTFAIVLCAVEWITFFPFFIKICDDLSVTFKYRKTQTSKQLFFVLAFSCPHSLSLSLPIHFIEIRVHLIFRFFYNLMKIDVRTDKPYNSEWVLSVPEILEPLQFYIIFVVHIFYFSISPWYPLFFSLFLALCVSVCHFQTTQKLIESNLRISLRNLSKDRESKKKFELTNNWKWSSRKIAFQFDGLKYIFHYLVLKI